MLFEYMRTQPESKSDEMYQRIRNSTEPLDVLSLSGLHNLPQQHSCEDDHKKALLGESTRYDTLEHENSFEGPVRLWTQVADGDLVSELTSAFFAYDNGSYLTFVDRECFMADLLAGDVSNATFCSPLLVNAICALRCVGDALSQP